MSHSRSMFVPIATITSVVALAYSIRCALLPFLRNRVKQFILNFLESADIYEGRDFIVHDENMYLDWIQYGTLGVGETYMSGRWDAIDRLDAIFAKLINRLAEKAKEHNAKWSILPIYLLLKLCCFRSPGVEGIQVGSYEQHGHDFVKLWLGSSAQLSCGYWKNATNLEDAQLAKLQLLAAKLKLQPGMKVLEIGCGWGILSCYLAKNYNVHVTGITLSEEQILGAKNLAISEQVVGQTSFKRCDFAKIGGTYDRIVSVEVVDSIGYERLEEFFNVMDVSLNDGGLVLVLANSSNSSVRYAEDKWFLKYITPTGFPPSLAQLCQFAEKKFVVEDVQNYGPDYDLTIQQWHKNFHHHVKAGLINKPEAIIRMWDIFFGFGAAGFRLRSMQVFSVVYSKKYRARYDAPR